MLHATAVFHRMQARYAFARAPANLRLALCRLRFAGKSMCLTSGDFSLRDHVKVRTVVEIPGRFFA